MWSKRKWLQKLNKWKKKLHCCKIRTRNSNPQTAAKSPRSTVNWKCSSLSLQHFQGMLIAVINSKIHFHHLRNHSNLEKIRAIGFSQLAWSKAPLKMTSHSLIPLKILTALIKCYRILRNRNYKIRCQPHKILVTNCNKKAKLRVNRR